jgi:hypothetical protein
MLSSVVDKVQDRGEEVVCIAEAQREEIMAKLIEVHETLQQLQDSSSTTGHNATT